MYLFQKIEEKSVHYNDARKNISEFLMNERSHAGNYSMLDIARMTYTSKATLTRYAKNLGFSGWVEFMEAFLKEAQYQESHFSEIDPNMPFTQADNANEIIEKLYLLETEALRDTADLLKQDHVERAVNIMYKADHIAVFGMSPNILCAELFRRKMESIGKLVSLEHGNEGGMLAGALNEKDCAIVVSYSGNNPNRIPMSYLDTLKQDHVPVIGITGQGESLLRSSSDVVLDISSREHLFTKITSFATEESVNFIFNTLFSLYFAKNYARNYNYKVGNSRKLEHSRISNNRDMQEKE